MIVGDLGTGGRDDADEGGLAHIGEADQAHIRDDLQLQLQVHILAGQAGLGKLGDLAGGGGKMAIAPAAAAATGDHHRLGTGKVSHDQAGLGFFQHSAAGHADDQVIGVGAALALGAAVFTVGCGVLTLVAEVHQGGEVVVGDKNDVTAATAVAAVRAASRHEFFAVEGHRAVAALAGMQPDGRGINKITGCHVLPR